MRLRVPLWVPVGIGLILLGVAGHAAIQHWMSTRIVYPVDMPVSLARGHIRTGPFRLNLKASYWVELDSGEWRADRKCSNPYPQTRTRWVLYKQGAVFDRSDDPTPLNWPTGFNAGSGVYDLDVEVPSDASCLDSGGPHLRVFALTENYEAAASLALGALAIGAYIGFVLLTFVPIVRFVRSFDHTKTVTESVSVGQDLRWARKLPLRRPISGLPAFGLFAGTAFAMLAILMMLLTGAFRYTSKGLCVSLLKPSVVPEKSDAWTEPLIVWVKYGGAGQKPNLYVNSKPVVWEDLDHALKEELGVRKDWVVYVGGDDEVAWQNVADVIDAARRRQAKVVLITRPEPTGEPNHRGAQR